MREHRIVVIDLNRRYCLAVVLRHKNSEQMKLTNALQTLCRPKCLWISVPDTIDIQIDDIPNYAMATIQF